EVGGRECSAVKASDEKDAELEPSDGASPFVPRSFWIRHSVLSLTIKSRSYFSLRSRRRRRRSSLVPPGSARRFYSGERGGASATPQTGCSGRRSIGCGGAAGRYGRRMIPFSARVEIPLPGGCLYFRSDPEFKSSRNR